MSRISDLIRRHKRDSLSVMSGYSHEESHLQIYKPQRGSLPESYRSGTQISEFQVSRIVRSKCLLSISPRLWHVFIAAGT